MYASVIFPQLSLCRFRIRVLFALMEITVNQKYLLQTGQEGHHIILTLRNSFLGPMVQILAWLDYNRIDVKECSTLLYDLLLPNLENLELQHQGAQCV